MFHSSPAEPAAWALRCVSIASLLSSVACASTGTFGGSARSTPDGRTPGCSPSPLLVAGAPLAPGLEVLDGDTVRAPQHLVHGLEARSAAGEVHVVVEIPAGTTAKFEVDKTSGHLVWDRADGRRRRIAFLPYPASYGMIPRTLVDESAGGDGDPVDVVMLGGAVARGAVVAARPIGVLRMRDEGERDDKIIAVLARDDSAFRDLDSLSALETRFPAVLRILELWFASYEGPGVVTVEGFEDRVAAERAIAEAIKAYEAARSRDP